MSRSVSHSVSHSVMTKYVLKRIVLTPGHCQGAQDVIRCTDPPPHDGGLEPPYQRPLEAALCFIWNL